MPLPNPYSDLEDRYGVEKPLITKTLNVTDRKMKGNKLQEKKESLAKKMVKGGMKAKMSVKQSFPKKGMKPVMSI